jgi:type II secretory pathway component PulK
MKFLGFGLRQNNKSGIILIVVLWVLAILSVLAVGLGREARIDLAVTKHRVGKLRADGLVWAAAHYAMNQIRLDAAKEQSLAADTIYQCGFSLQDGKTPQDIFKNVFLKDGSFDISYILDAGQGQRDVCYGFQDEERRININGIHKQNSKILVHLFLLLHLSEQQAQRLADQIVDWRDADSEKVSASYGAEKEDYMSSLAPYGCKDLPFENIEELLLLKDMTQADFQKIKEYLTVFPRMDTSLSMNINTASDIVLQSLFRFLAEQNPSVEMSDADSLVEKIVLYRKGEDGRLCTEDDRPLLSTASGPLGLNPNELAIYLTATNYFKESSRYFRIGVKGRDRQYNVFSKAEMIIDRDENQSLVSWKRK